MIDSAIIISTRHIARELRLPFVHGAGYWGRTAIQRVCNDLLTMLRSVVIASKDIPKTFFVRLNAEFTAWFLR